LEDYEAALENYKKADQIDPTLNAKDQFSVIYERVKEVDHAIASKVLANLTNSNLLG
jgi:hypothetical protein